MLAGSASRTRRATPTTLSWQPEGSDGEPADPGDVTVAVTTADGTEVLPAGTATSGTDSDPRTVGLTAAQTASLDVLTAVWTADDVEVGRTEHDIVGGFYFSFAEVREAEPTLADTTKYPDAKVLVARAEVETFIEGVCGAAFVPRFNRVAGYVDGDTVTLHPYLRSVRWARYRSYNGITYTPLTSDELATVGINDIGVIVVPYCDNAYEIGYEHGAARPPADIKDVAMALTRMTLNRPKSGVPAQAVSMTSPDGASFNFGRIGTKWRPTGVEWIDEILLRPDYNFRLAGTML